MDFKREQIGVLTAQDILDDFGGSGGPLASGAVPPVDTVQVLPPGGGDLAPDPNSATVNPPQHDIGLLVAGGLAVFSLIAFGPSFGKKLSGVPSAKWMLPAVGVVGVGLIYWQHQKKIQGYRDYINQVLTTVADASQSAQVTQGVAKMTDKEVCDLYIILHDYTVPGKALSATDLARYNSLMQKYFPMIS